MNATKRVYLDQKDWIALARVHNGKEKDPELKEIYEDFFSLAESGRASFPISYIHLAETWHIKDKGKQERLIDFMLLLSKGDAICPYTTVLPFQIRNALHKRFGLPERDETNIVFGNGISHLFGGEFSLSPDSRAQLGEERYEELMKGINSVDTMKKGIQFLAKEIGHDDPLRQTEHVQNLEEMRKRYKKYTDKDFLLRLKTAENLLQFVGPEIEKMRERHGITQEEIALELGSREALDDILNDIPSLKVLSRLTDIRDRDYDRQIEANDNYDIASLSTAIPYCDVVTTDTMFASIANNQGLGELYNTKIVSSLKDISL